MPPDDTRQYRAGQSIEDLCRACKADRMHTIIVVDPAGKPLRVSCGFCGSEHNYRGGPMLGTRAAPAQSSGGSARGGERSRARDTDRLRDPFPFVADRELSGADVQSGKGENPMELERLLRRIIREEVGLSPVAPADKWRGGHLVLRPGNSTQEKTWPIETFFHKIVMLRNRLRTLEQHINATDLPEDVKVRLQTYITGCYGSLTSFNILFAEEDDQFRGSGGATD